MSESSLIVDTESGVTHVRFRDNSILDALMVQRIGKELVELLETSESRKVVLDFCNVRFISSEALRLLLSLRSRADRSAATMALCSIRPELAKVFKLTNLDKLFPIYEDAARAAAAMSP